MNQTQLRQLIARLVAEIVEAPPAANALVLFTGALLGFEDSLASLGRLKGAVHLDWTQTDSARRILDQPAIDAVGMTSVDSSLVVSHDLLIVATLTVNMAAKVATGVGDCLASNVIAEFIMSGKPVVAVTNAACPDSADKRGWFPAMPEGYAAMLRGNLRTLASFGVRLTTAADLDRTVRGLADASVVDGPDCELKVISEAVVSGIAPGGTLRIRGDAVVTDLAREAATAAHVTLERV